MSNAAADVEVRLKFVDKGASSGITKYAKEVEKSTKQAETAVTQSNTRQRSSYEKLSHARETLGIRSEQTIQREIKQTESAYKRLEASGTMSQAALARAADKTKSKITSLTNEMGKLTHEQEKAARAAKEFEKTQSRLRLGGALALGGAAAAYTLKAPVMEAMSFEEQLALRANTMYAEYDYAGKKQGEDAMRAGITNAVKNGMTKNAALDALNVLSSGNQVGGAANELDLLPFIAKVSTGQGAAGNDVANMLNSLMSSGFAKNIEQAKRMVEQGAGAGKAGQFEMPDMARELPALLPAARAAGLTGEGGYKKLLVWLQQARAKSGSSSEAANNVANALDKLQSGDTAKDFKKAGRGDLATMLMQKQASGIDPLTAWKEVISSEVAKNPNLKPALEKLKSAKNVDDHNAAIEALNGMAGGQALGKYFQDRQAKSGMISSLDLDFGKVVSESIAKSSGSIGNDFGYMETKPGFKVRRAGELKDLGENTAADTLTPIIGKLADNFSELSAKYPALIGSTTLATTGLTALAGAAGLASIALGGGKASLPGVVGSGASIFSKVAPPLAVYGGAYSVIDQFIRPGLDKTLQWGSGDKNKTLDSTVYPIYSAIENLFNSDKNPNNSMIKPDWAKKQNAEIKITVDLAPGLVQKQQSTKADGVDLTTNTGNLFKEP